MSGVVEFCGGKATWRRRLQTGWRTCSGPRNGGFAQTTESLRNIGRRKAWKAFLYASLIRDRNRSSSNRSLAAAATLEVCTACAGSPKSRPQTADRCLSRSFVCHRCQTASFRSSTATASLSLGLLGRLNAHRPPASAANAGGFLQTLLSEVIRRSPFRLAPAISRRITPYRVMALTRDRAIHLLSDKHVSRARLSPSRIVNGKPGLRRIAFRVNGTLLPEIAPR
jgi:hypothetical protein